MSDLLEPARSFVASWAETFNTRQPERLLALYSEDALLYGTSMAPLFVGREQIRSYFRGRSTVSLGALQHYVPLGADCVLAVGAYTFERRQDGQAIASPARFTFVLVRESGA